MPVQLPIDAALPAIVDAARSRRAAVIVAAPGAGKTTRVPPALSALGPAAVLQPRRMAARALARRVAAEQGWTLGRETGWHVRGDRHFSPGTRVLFMTEGILAARLQRDPLAGAFRAIVLDEFHERTIHADLALAMAREAWRARDDLALVVMSATLDARRVARFLDDAPVIEVEGRLHPLAIEYEPDGDPAALAARELAAGAKGVLCFMPGAFEIRRTLETFARLPLAANVEALPLHGALDADEQDRAMRPPSVQRLTVATNIAETSLTVPDVTVVIDAGLQRVSRYDSERGIDVLLTERITQDAADQRAGRAGRVAAGRAIRLWSRADRLRPHREPEIGRVDLASTVLTILAWGGTPATLEWLDPPSSGAVDAAYMLLRRLGAVDANGRITEHGLRMRDLPLHPRLSRVLIEAGGSFEAAAACALLAEPRLPVSRHDQAVASSCDLLPLIDRWQSMPHHLRAAAAEYQSETRREPREGEAALRRALFAGFGDRLARRREPRGRMLLLASGSGARQGAESGVVDAEFLVCLDVSTGSGEPIVRLASAVDREWLQPTHAETAHVLAEDGSVRAMRTAFVDAIPISSNAVKPDPVEAARVLAAAFIERSDRDERVQTLLRRCAFAGVSVDLAALAEQAAPGAARLGDIDIEPLLPHAARASLSRTAPLTLTLPSGRAARLEYRADGTVFAAAKLQELFGLTETPRIGTTPVTFELLSPAGRPVQITQDLASFWRRGYPEVRKELRARYPRHPWPEDPLTAAATARAKPRGT